jgi:hypothetical protein
MLIVGLVCILSLGIPVVTLVFVYLLNERVKRIESRLNLGGETQGE